MFVRGSPMSRMALLNLWQRYFPTFVDNWGLWIEPTRRRNATSLYSDLQQCDLVFGEADASNPFLNSRSSSCCVCREAPCSTRRDKR